MTRVCRGISLCRLWEFTYKLISIAGPFAAAVLPDCRGVKIQIPNLIDNPGRRTAACFVRSILAILAIAFSPAGTATSPAPVVVLWDTNPESDIAGYTFYLGTGSGNYSQILNVGNSTTTTLADLSPGTTYFCAVQAYNTAGLTSALSTEISFVTPEIGTAYSQWAAASGLSGPAAAAMAQPFSDGVPNLMKYACNLNATGPDRTVLARGVGTAGLPVFALEGSGSQSRFTVEYLRRKDGGLVYTPMVSSDLVNFAPMTGSTFVTNIDGDWERVVLQMPCDPEASPSLFGRVEVTLP
jgi:hypothetical protein